MRIWDTATGKISARRLESRVNSAAWLGLGALALGGSAGLFLFDFITDTLALARIPSNLELATSIRHHRSISSTDLVRLKRLRAWFRGEARPNPSLLQVELVLEVRVGRHVAERVVDAPMCGLLSAVSVSRPPRSGVALAGLPDRLGLHPAAEAVPAVLGQHAGAVVLGVARAVAGDDQFGEPGDRAVRLVDGDDGVQQVAALVRRPAPRPGPGPRPRSRCRSRCRPSACRPWRGATPAKVSARSSGTIPSQDDKPVAGMRLLDDRGQGGEVHLGQRQPGEGQGQHLRGSPRAGRNWSPGEPASAWAMTLRRPSSRAAVTAASSSRQPTPLRRSAGWTWRSSSARCSCPAW